MMKLLVGAAVPALAIAIGPVLAQTAPPPPPGVAQGTTPVAHAPQVWPMPPMNAMPAMPHLQGRMHMMMMSDRTMTRDEVVGHVREIFAKLDANKDGFLSREEIEAFHHRFADMGANIHKRMDEHGAMMRGDRGAMFDRLDSNHDGMISRQEFMAAQPNLGREGRVVILRDGDASGHDGMAGMNGMHEMHMRMHMDGMGMDHGAMDRMGGGFAGHLFEMADANHDGRVSLQEAERLALQHFDRADLNHDGKITPDEQRQAHEMMRREHRPS
jgi:hypothetical protein